MIGTELWRALLALPLLALVGWLPGYVLCRGLIPRQGRLLALAAAPALSAGALYCVGELCTTLGLPVDERLAGAVVVLAVAGLVRELRHGRPPAPSRLVTSALLLGTSWGALLWGLGLRRLTAVAPHDDGYNHGFFIKRLAETRTLDPVTAIPHDVLLGGHAVDYYPLALHQQAAVLVRALDLDVAVAWNLTALSLVVVGLPLGMLALTRELFGGRPRVAAAAAVLSAVVPGLSYSTSWWGGYPLPAGLAAAPGALLLALHACRAVRPTPVLVAALALAGIAGIHTSELSLVLLVVGVLLVVEKLQERSLRALLVAGAGLAVVSLMTLLLLAPALLQLKRGLDERAYPPADAGEPLGSALREVLVQYSFVPPVTPAAVVLTFWAGLIACLATRRALGWAAAWGVFAVLYVWLAAYPGDLVNAVTATWYSDRFRLGYILAFLSVPFLAYAVAGAGHTVRRELRLIGPVLGAVLAVTSSVASVEAIRQNYRDFSLVGGDERAAFAFLADRVGPREHVLNQHQDGSPWMYALADVAPVVALKTFGFDRPEWADAGYLARNVQRAGTDARVARLLDQFEVRYVYVGPRVFPTQKPDLDRDALARSSALRLVFESGDTRVYEVVRR